eukprot:Gb_29356 [translate_table: standard]
MSDPNSPPKLFTNKPKKRGGPGGGGGAGPKAEALIATTTLASSAPSSRMEPPRQSFIHRYKLLWPALLVVNLAVGGYVLLRTKTKTADLDEVKERQAPDDIKKIAVVNETEAQTMPNSLSSPVIPVVHGQIPEDEQRQLFKWILEEKRKVKAANSSEKSQIDKEKAILKQYITSDKIPSL